MDAALDRGRSLSYIFPLGGILVSAMLFVLPFRAGRTFEEILFFALFAVFAAGKLLERGKEHLRSRPHEVLSLLLLGSFLWSLVSLSNAVDPVYSLNEIIDKLARQYVLYFLVFYVASGTMSEERMLKWLFFPLAIAVLLMSLYACYQFFQSPVILDNRATGFTGGFYRLSVFLVISIPLIFVLANVFRGGLRWLMAATLAGALAALVFTFTRAAWLAVAAEFVFLVHLLVRRHRKALFALVLATAVVGGVGAYNSIHYNKVIVHGSEKPRIGAVQRAWEIIRANPLTGIGFGKKSYMKYYSLKEGEASHAHNIFLNTAVETGIPGVAIFLAIIWVVIRILLKGLRHERSPVRRLFICGIMTSVVGFVAINFFDYMYLGWPGQMFWILIGLGNGLIAAGESGRGKFIASDARE